MTRATVIDTTNRFTIADLNTEIDDEPRVLDVALGQRLGFSRPRAIRQIIERNADEISTYGSLATRRGKSRGQAFTEYFLNEGQSLLLCMFAKTTKAASVRKMLIDVFMEYRSGRIGKPISVRPHTRRPSTKIDNAISLARSASRLESVADKIQPQPQNMCAMVINGESVFVDVNKYDGAGRAVTIEHDGSIRIQRVEPSYSDFKPMGARTSLGEHRYGHGGRLTQSGVTVLGMVMEQGAPAMQPMQIEHEHVKAIANPRAPYKDKILALLGTGLTSREIAERVGCTVHGVKYWRNGARAAG